VEGRHRLRAPTPSRLSPSLFAGRVRIVEFAATHRMPTMYFHREL
jgi:hypothetical protein